LHTSEHKSKFRIPDRILLVVQRVVTPVQLPLEKKAANLMWWVYTRELC